MAKNNLNQSFSRLNLPENNLDGICRVCLSDTKVLFQIEEISFTHSLNMPGIVEDISLAEVFLRFCNTTVTSSDGKPSKICEHCLTMSCKAFNFFQLFLCANELIEVRLKGPPREPKQIAKATNKSGLVKFYESMLELRESWHVEEDNVDIRQEHDYSDTQPKVTFDKLCERIKLQSSSGEDKEKKKENIFNCKICNTRLWGIKKVIVHAKENHPKETLCLICFKPYEPWEYNYHLATHSSKAVDVCKMCRLYFESPEELAVHKASFDHSVPFCYLCKRKFYGRMPQKSVRAHIKHVHFKPEKHKCQTCGKEFLYDINLRRHVRVSHMKEPKYLCQHCAKSYTTNHALKIHMQRDHNIDTGIDLERKKQYYKSYNKRLVPEKNPIVECQYCNIPFNTTHEFYVHASSHPAFKDYQCEICPLNFETLEALRGHQTEHVQHECTECGERFLMRTQLMQHKHNKHLGNTSEPMQTFTCQFCQKVYNRKHAFYRHSAAHSEFKDFECLSCEKRFEEYDKLQAHMGVHKTHQCPICPMKFATKGTLSTHKYKHKYAKKMCNVCGLTVSSGKPGLIQHMKVHTGKRPHLCEVCGKGFKQVAHLATHMHQHGLEKPWRCKLCDKTFQYNSLFKNHMRSHTGEKPYSCPFCEKLYRDTTIRHKHIKKSHPERFEEYQNCRKNQLSKD